MDEPFPYQNLLVIRPRFIGDLILATGLAMTSKETRPGAKVTFLADAPFAELLQGHPAIDEVLEFDPNRKNNLPYLWRFLRVLRAKKFDAVLDLFGNPRTAQWTYFSGAKARVGYKLRGRSWAYNRVAPPSSPMLPSGRRPVTEAYLDQWRALGYPSPAKYWTSLFVPEEERAHARKLLERAQLQTGEKVMALCPGASHPAKQWPLEKFVELARRLSGQGVRPLFLFGPKDRESADRLVPMLEGGWVFVKEPTLRGLAALIQASQLLVSNDAGPMHVGPAVGTPTVGIFGPGEPEIWFPYGPPHQYAYREISCSHCGHDVCPLPKLDCMDQLGVEDVEALVRQALGLKPASKT